jgi:hypothetical protein
VSVDWLSSVLIQSSSHCAMPRSRIVMLCTVPAEYLQIEIFLCSLNSVSSRYTLRLCESGLPLQGLCFELYGSVSRLGQGPEKCFYYYWWVSTMLSPRADLSPGWTPGPAGSWQLTSSARPVPTRRRSWLAGPAALGESPGEEQHIGGRSLHTTGALS